MAETPGLVWIIIFSGKGRHVADFACGARCLWVGLLRAPLLRETFVNKLLNKTAWFCTAKAAFLYTFMDQ